MFSKKKPTDKMNKGITLIALAVTIIVLLVLAGIPIATLMNKNGVIEKTQESAKETENKQQEVDNMVDEFAESMSKNKQIKFSITPNKWTNSNSVTVSATSITGNYEVQLRKSGEDWQKPGTSITVNEENQKVEGRIVYSDGTYSEDIESITVTNIAQH